MSISVEQIIDETTTVLYRRIEESNHSKKAGTGGLLLAAKTNLDQADIERRRGGDRPSDISQASSALLAGFRNVRDEMFAAMKKAEGLEDTAYLAGTVAHAIEAEGLGIQYEKARLAKKSDHDFSMVIGKSPDVRIGQNLVEESIMECSPTSDVAKAQRGYLTAVAAATKKALMHLQA